MRRHAKASTAGSTDCQATGLGHILDRGSALLFAALGTALLALVFAGSAQAVTYSSGAPILPGKRPASVAVNQTSGDLYVAGIGVTAALFGPDGALQRFDSAGTELSCALSPAPPHPAGLAIDPSNGNILSVNLAASPTDSELRTFPAGCGSELPVNTGTADTTSGSSELTAVSMAHPLQVNQGVSGPGIPTATATADYATGSPMVTNLSGASGNFAVGQAVFGSGITGGSKILACIPSCAAPSELELSANPVASATGAKFLARTTVSSVAGSTVTLSNPAEATGAGVAISGMAWRIEAPATAPIGQPAADTSGNLYWPNRPGSKLQKFAPWGEELVEGSFPNTTSMNRVGAVARDAKGNLYVTTSGAATTFTCANNAAAKLKKLQPDGSEFPEGGPIGPESVFGGLAANATTVAVDGKTGNVYVGRNCQATFQVEVYGPGGTKLAEFGSGSFAAVVGFTSGTNIVNQLAVDEDDGTLYAADPGNEAVQVFDNTSASKTLATSVPGGNGAIECNGTGSACLAEYDEGQEVIVEAVPDEDFAFKEWAGGTGSATSCNGSANPSCTFLLGADSSIQAVFEEAGFDLTVDETGNGSGAVTCEVNGGGAGACAGPYEEGDTLKVVAAPDTGSTLDALTGTGSAAGNCTLGTGICEFTINADSEVSAEFNLESRTLGINESGNGSGAVSCEDNGTPTSCAGPFLYGHTIKVTASPDAGSSLAALSGTGSANGNCNLGTGTCEFAITEASEVSAEFNLESRTLTINEPGGGTGTVSCEDNGTPASCAGPFLYGHTIKVIATASGESTLGSLSGTGSAAGNCTEETETAGSCEFEITQNSEVSATFVAPGSATLLVYKGGNGGGTVTSDPAGIDCGAEPCEATYGSGEPVQLQASADSGAVFAGWIGCKPVSGEISKCNVIVNGPTTEVTAIFLTEGQSGEPGEGVTVTPEPAGANCANGGVKVESEAGTSYVCNGAPGSDGTPGQGVTVTPEAAGPNCALGGVKVESSAGTTYVCNGATGTPGQGATVTNEPPGLNCALGGVRIVSQSGTAYVCNGAAGPQGPSGSDGQSGQTGAQGQSGAQGAAGPQGPTGPQGPEGKQGPAGKVTVTCKVKSSGKVTCKVEQPKAKKRKRLSWSLRKGKRTLSHGKTTAKRLERVLNRLRPGRYVLRVEGQAKPVVIEVGR